MNKVSIKKPNALVVIYNYKDRTGDSKINSSATKPKEEKDSSRYEVDQIILNTLSLKSVSTQKSKSNPVGAFEIRLAPYKNWVAAITPGSWCVILMSNYLLDDTAKYGKKVTGEVGKVDQKSFKMLGRIESVRGVSNTNQLTGATETEYIVTGSDWGVVFASSVYVDPLSRTKDENQIGMAERFGYDDYLKNIISYDSAKFGKNANTKALIDKTKKDNATDYVQDRLKVKLDESKTDKPDQVDSSKIQLPTTKTNIDFILSLWGRSDPATSELEKVGIMGKSRQAFILPEKLSSYMGFSDKSGAVSPYIAQIIKTIHGKLIEVGDKDIDFDKYDNQDFSIGVIDFNTILGEHTVWNILRDNCNQIVNELIPEIRFNKKGKPSLTLYNRVLPFTINDIDKVALRDAQKVGDNEKAYFVDIAKRYMSQFKNLKRVHVAKEDVILCSYGTNWRDRVNFIETLIIQGLYPDGYNSDIKLKAQFVDEDSIARDGLLPMRRGSSYVPCTNDGTPEPLGVMAYKYVLKEWHFNTHKMLNGTLNLIGQDAYIQVGDNIMVDSSILGRSHNMNVKQKSSKTTYLLAHVESISHQCSVSDTGARHFSTSINFVRGVITDVDGNFISDFGGALDQDASLLNEDQEINSHNISTSTPVDPDQGDKIKRGK